MGLERANLELFHASSNGYILLERERCETSKYDGKGT